MKQQSILLLAGEASGDYHAAALVRDILELKPNTKIIGIGGDALQKAGMQLLHHYREVNTIGLSEGFSKLKHIKAAYDTMRRELASGKHSVFIPVDFPDVNIRLCRFAKAAGIPVYYFISPQIWAWRKGRIKKIAQRVSKMMTIFPFEEKVYRAAGVEAEFVGHTMIRDLENIPDRRTLRDKFGFTATETVVLLAPGSRPAEIRRMLPRMCEAALEHAAKYSGIRFTLPLAGEHLSELVNDILAQYQNVDVTIFKDVAPELMAAADYGLITSGTATLQAALVGMPHAVVYMLDNFSWYFAIYVIKPLLMDKNLHVAISNVLAINSESEAGSPLDLYSKSGIKIPCEECGRPLFVPELLQFQATPIQMASWLERFHQDEKLVSKMRGGFQWLKQSLVSDNPRKAANLVVQLLESRS